MNHNKERDYLQSLGKLIPITTPQEPIIMNIAESRSQGNTERIKLKKCKFQILLAKQLLFMVLSNCTSNLHVQNSYNRLMYRLLQVIIF